MTKNLNQQLIDELFCDEKNYDEISYLLENGADCNINADTMNRTPLMIAILYNDEDLAKKILEYPADVTVRDTDHFSALEMVESLPERYLIKKLIEDNISFLQRHYLNQIPWQAIGHQRTSDVVNLLRQGADPNFCYDQFGINLFHLALHQQDENLALAILDFPVQLNSQFYDGEFTKTALELADSYQLKKVAQKITDKFAELNHEFHHIFNNDAAGSRRNRPYYVRHLLQQGANPDFTPNHTTTNPALFTAVAEQNLAALNLMLEYGANPAVKNIYGQSCIELLQQQCLLHSHNTKLQKSLLFEMFNILTDKLLTDQYFFRSEQRNFLENVEQSLRTNDNAVKIFSDSNLIKLAEIFRNDHLVTELENNDYESEKNLTTLNDKKAMDYNAALAIMEGRTDIIKPIATKKPLQNLPLPPATVREAAAVNIGHNSVFTKISSH